MKNLLLALTILAISCGNFKRDNIKRQIPGTYTKRIVNEHNIGTDTLIIDQTNDNVFRITRRITVSKTWEGKQMPAASKVETWTTLYNDHEQVLRETQEGKIISFLVEDGKLMVERSEYLKLKNK